MPKGARKCKITRTILPQAPKNFNRNPAEKGILLPPEQRLGNQIHTCQTDKPSQQQATDHVPEKVDPGQYPADGDEHCNQAKRRPQRGEKRPCGYGDDGGAGGVPGGKGLSPGVLGGDGGKV